jgi:hypothetical protein
MVRKGTQDYGREVAVKPPKTSLQQLHIISRTPLDTALPSFCGRILQLPKSRNLSGAPAEMSGGRWNSAPVSVSSARSTRSLPPSTLPCSLQETNRHHIRTSGMLNGFAAIYV